MAAAMMGETAAVMAEMPVMDVMNSGAVRRARVARTGESV